jgi:TRAP-type C4-dicarboxylate transport system permease small subunit
MFNSLIPICAVITTFFFVYKLVELSVRKKERMRLIEFQRENFAISHLNDSFLFPRANILPQDNVFSPEKKSYGALKAGCLLLGLGFGIMAAWVFSTIFFDHYVSEIDNYRINQAVRNGQEAIYFGSVLFFGGMGLLIAFIIERKMRRKDNCEKTHPL